MPTAAMTPPTSGRPSLFIYATFTLIVMTSSPVSALEPETCFSRQHQSAIVDVRLALNRPTTAMDPRVVRSERDCVLACCSEEVKPGAKCNMVVFNGNKHAGDDNCFLFHCQTEQDCPLTKAQDGINTYDIYKGLLHPTTVRPPTTTTTTTTTTTLAPTTPTTTQSTTLKTTTTMPPTTTTMTTTTTTTTTLPTTTTPTPTPTPTPPPIIIIATMAAVTSSPTTAKAPPLSTTSMKKPNKTTKKQTKTSRKGKLHPISITTAQPTQTSTPTTTTTPTPTPTTSLPVVTMNKEAKYRTTEKLQPKTETTTITTLPTTTTPLTTTPTTTTTTTTTPPTTTTTTIPSTTTTNPPPHPSSTITPTTTTTTTPTTTTTESSTTRTTPAATLLIVPKGAAQSDHVLQNSSAARGKGIVAHGVMKSGMVAFVVLVLAILTMALAIGGRKAMESFDRRHYTRLELNDLHYEV